MSLTKKQEPDLLSPIINPIPIVYSSSYADQSGFRYKIDLINSASTTELSLWLYPDSNNSNYCIYDFSRILNDLIGSNPENYNTTDFVKSEDSIYMYSYSVTEYIGTTSGDTVTESVYYAFRGLKQYGETWNMDNYLPYSASTEASFLSNKLYRTYKLDEYATINTIDGTFNFDHKTDIVRLVIEVYTASVGKPYYIENNLNSKTVKILTMPFGPKNLNDAALAGNVKYGTGTTATSEIINSDDLYYDVYLLNSAGHRVSEIIRVTLDHSCYKHDGVEFLWLGELSTFETMKFRAADIKSYKTSRNEVKSNYYGINNDNYTYSIGDRGRKNVNVSTTERHNVLSGWVKDDESKDIMDLINSPEVYIIKEGEIWPIIVTLDNYEEKTIQNNTLYNYNITYEMAYEKLSNI